MTSSTHVREEHDNLLSPLARIEAQDQELVNPLREYLEQYGCKVSVNRESTQEPLYVICVGDAMFVKAFFEEQYFRDAKKLAIIYEGTEEDIASIQSQKIKFYFIDPVPITQDIARDIFSFFFRQQGKIKSNRKGLARQKSVSVISKQTSHEHVTVAPEVHVDEDAKRISDTMKQIFQPRVKQVKKQSLHSKIFGWVMVTIVGVMAPAVGYFAALGIGVVFLIASGNALVKGNYPATTMFLNISTTYIQSSRTIVHVSAPLFAVLNKQNVIEDQDRLLSIFSDVALAEKNSMEILSQSKQIAGGILVPNETSDRVGVSDVMNLTTDVHRVAQLLGLVAAELNSLVDAGRFPFNTRMVSTILNRGSRELQRIRTVIGYTEKMLTIYPRIGGFRKKQTFLVLLQNSMELRPTGGFIGSLVLVSFEDGKVDAMDVQDVYTADGQLKGHVDPPGPLKEILGQEHWYLRDSNWDPDFTVSGKQAAWFYEKEMGVAPDGVIALSLPMVTKLLHATGPVELLDFNERISESNFYAKSLLYTNTDFFPGSTQKKDFLGSLTTALLGKLTTDRSISAGLLLNIISESLQSKDLQFYFTDPELETLVTQWGWTGGVSVSTCVPPTQNTICVGDGVGFVNANLGVNKLDYFIKQEALSQISFGEDGFLDHTLTYTVENTSTLDPNNGGVYQAYLRLLVPKGTALQSITIDGEPVPGRDITKPAPPPPPYFLLEDRDTASLIHLPYSVQPRQKRQIVFHFTRQITEPLRDTIAYQIQLRKQPGVDTLPWHVVVSYPMSWIGQSSSGVANQGELRYNTDLTKDEEYQILFQKHL